MLCIPLAHNLIRKFNSKAPRSLCNCVLSRVSWTVFDPGCVAALKTTFLHAIPLITTLVVLMTSGLLLDSLIVQVSRSDIRIKFGVGIIRESITVDDVQAASLV